MGFEPEVFPSLEMSLKIIDSCCGSQTDLLAGSHIRDTDSDSSRHSCIDSCK